MRKKDKKTYIIPMKVTRETIKAYGIKKEDVVPAKIVNKIVLTSLNPMMLFRPGLLLNNKKQGFQQSVIVTECLKTFDLKLLGPIYLSLRDINTTHSTCTVYGNISISFVFCSKPFNDSYTF